MPIVIFCLSYDSIMTRVLVVLTVLFASLTASYAGQACHAAARGKEVLKYGTRYHLPPFDPGLCFGSYTSFMSSDYPA